MKKLKKETKRRWRKKNRESEEKRVCIRKKEGIEKRKDEAQWREGERNREREKEREKKRKRSCKSSTHVCDIKRQLVNSNECNEHAK